MSLKDIMSRGAFWAKKHSPEILTTTSAVAGLGALAFAFIKADKVKEKIRDHKERMEELNKNLEEMDEMDGEEKLTDMEKRQVKTAEYIQTGKEVIKEAWPIILLEAISLGTNIAGCVSGHKRYANASAALATLTSAFGLYRSRVAEKYGKDEERALYLGESEEEVEYVELDSEGKEQKKKKAIKKYEAATPYCVVFESQWKSEDGVNYVRNPRIGSEYFESFENNKLRLDFLKGVKRQCNNLLYAKGHLYLSEVFDLIGYKGYQMDKEELNMARRCGWVLNKHHQVGDDFVLFGIEDENMEHVKRFEDDDDDNILLSFNCVGDIYGLLKEQYMAPREFFRG